MRLLPFTLIGLAVFVWVRPIQGQTDSAEAPCGAKLRPPHRGNARGDHDPGMMGNKSVREDA